MVPAVDLPRSPKSPGDHSMVETTADRWITTPFSHEVYIATWGPQSGGEREENFPHEESGGWKAASNYASSSAGWDRQRRGRMQGGNVLCYCFDLEHVSRCPDR